MLDLFLKFTDQAEAHSVLQSFTYTDEEGALHLAQGSHQHALWEVGEIPGRDGWHVNLRVLDPAMDLSALEPHRVYPATPDCVWA